MNHVPTSSITGPANAIRRPELGSFGAGNPGDATVLELAEGAFEFEDARGGKRTGTQHLKLKGMVIGGRWWA